MTRQDEVRSFAWASQDAESGESGEPQAGSWASGRLLGFDLETTGIDPFSDVPVSAGLVYVQGGRTVSVDHFLIDPGRGIPPQAVAVHGITTARAASEGVALEAGISHIIAALSFAATSGAAVAGMNLSYDLTMIDTVFRRQSGTGMAVPDLRVIDVLVVDRHFDRFRKGKRTLEMLCNHYGVDLSSAHDAAGDASAAVAIAIAQATRYPELAGMSLDDLHASERKWHQEWADGYSRWLTEQGRAPLQESSWHWPVASQKGA
ncbi:MAG: exonuclease domain-containing protein [Acidimicrobiales bacterium]